MPQYSAYGCLITSDLKLPSFAPATQALGLELTVRRASVRLPPDARQDGSLRYSLVPDSWVFEWEEAAYRLTSDAIGVDVRGSEGEIVARLGGQILGLWLRRRGRMVLHANVVADERGAIALMGATGAGKTTLTQALVRSGFRFLSDDLCVLDPDGWLVHGGPGRLKIRVGQAGKRLESIEPTWGGVHLRRIVVIEPGTPVEVTAMQGHEFVLAAVRHAHMPRSLDETGLAPDHFELAGRLAAEVQGVRLRRGSTLDDLPEALSVVEA